MVLDLQFKIKNNPNYIKYLRENSNWYKYLNRNPAAFSLFEQEVKEKYALRASDKISNALKTFELIENLFTSLK